MSCARVGSAEDDAGVLLRKETLGNDDEQIARRGDSGEEDQQRRETMTQDEIEARS